MNISTKAALFLFDAKSKSERAIGKTKDYLGRKAKSIVKEENGDTNFISIIIILAIVLLVAIVFISFKDYIINWFNETVSSFNQKASSTKNKGFKNPTTK